MPIHALTTTRRRVLRIPHVRAANQAAVLHLLRRHQRLSRAEIARRTGLSEAAVSRIVAGLMARDLVVEQGGEDSTGGRPGIRLQLNESRFQAVGVDIQLWETRVSVGTISGRIVCTERFRTSSSPEKTLRTVADAVEAHYEQHPDVRERGVGISVRGLINSQTGVAELGSDPAWIHVAVKEPLEQILRTSVSVENNVRAAALAEYNYGTPDIQSAHCLVFIKVDEGIGMGIVLDGKLYRGPRMAAGEIGQMVITDSPGPERHDRPGCLEMLASDHATCERYQRLVGGRPKGALGSVTDQVRRICHMAMSGDEAAREAVRQTARYLGIGIFNAVWALDVEAVIIDGAITEAWPLVRDAVRDQFPVGSEFLNFRNLTLRPSSLGGEAAIIGAFTLPFATLFSAEGSPH